MAESDRALLLLDMVTDRVRAVPSAASILKYVAGELRYFRERGRPVIFACTAPDLEALPPVVQELTPRSDERVILKSAPSAFFDTDLEGSLRELRVKRLTLVGLETHTSVLFTAADAAARGFEVVVPEVCVCANDPDDHRFALRLIREVLPRWGADGAAPSTQLLRTPPPDLDETGRQRRAELDESGRARPSTATPEGRD